MRHRCPKFLTTALVLCLLAVPAFAGGEGWSHDFEAAKKQAAEQNKDMLLDFTGSDWCGWCIKLVDEVFSKDEFKAYAEANLVLVEIDFPRDKSKLSDETTAQNAELKDAYGIRGYPTIYLTDHEGLPYAKTGYRRGGPEAYAKHLEELKQVRVERDEHMAAAKSAEGLEKAKHLHAAMQVVGDDMATQHYKDTVQEIVSLDADNEAGLKKHYDDIVTAKAQKKVIQQVMRSAQADPEGAITKLDELVDSEDTLVPVRQEALALKSQIQMFVLKDKATAKTTLIQAIEADPESDMAKQLKEALERVFSDDA
ncbi:MAG: thioredoxin family protein [Phycisphaeraceae bacterium]|nr:thioredoxin family protein [Phycisphaeraceae bacterium]